MKSRKNYFEEIKNSRVEDKFIEHLIRLLFFTIVISIESGYKRMKGGLAHVKNFFMSRTMSDMLQRYSGYKETVHSLIERTVRRKRLHRHIHEMINSQFSEYEKRIIFGIKESKDSIMTSSRRVITSMKGYTSIMSARYFKSMPEISVTKKISSAVLSIQLLKQLGHKESSKKSRDDIAEKIIYLNKVASNYRKFMEKTYNKFYSREFKDKITATSSGMKTVKNNIEKMIDTAKRLEQKQVKYRLGEYHG